MTLRIFQKGFHFSQDGPGNRLVYHLQGCNLRCPWCANPEGLCPEGGTEYTVDALVEEVLRSRMLFFEGGGVTLTGGEATLQFAAVREFLTRLHREGIHTCIETNGLSHRLPELFPVLDLLIMDVKHYDPEVHRRVTGGANTQTLENLSAALAWGEPLALRIPLIGGFNAEETDAVAFGALFQKFGITEVELLPYHEFGKDKYRKQGLPYTMTEQAKISPARLARYRELLEAAGVRVIKT